MNLKHFALFFVVLLILSIGPVSAMQIDLKNSNELGDSDSWDQQYNGALEPPSSNSLIGGAIEEPTTPSTSDEDIESIYPGNQINTPYNGYNPATGSNSSSNLVHGAIENPTGAAPSHIDIEGLYPDTQTGFSTETKTRKTVIIVVVVVIVIVITVVTYGTLTGPAAEAVGETGGLVGVSEAAGETGGLLGGSGAAVDSIISGSSAAGKGIGLAEVVQTGSEIIAGAGVVQTVTTILKNQKKSTNQDTESQVTNNMPLQSPRTLTKQKINTQSESLDAVEEVNTKPKTQPIQEDDKEINGEQDNSISIISNDKAKPIQSEREIKKHKRHITNQNYYEILNIVKTNGTAYLVKILEAVYISSCESSDEECNDTINSIVKILSRITENYPEIAIQIFYALTKGNTWLSFDIIENIDPSSAAELIKNYTFNEADDLLEPIYAKHKAHVEKIIDALKEKNNNLSNKLNDTFDWDKNSSKY